MTGPADRARGILLVGGRRHGEWFQPMLGKKGRPVRRTYIMWPIEIPRLLDSDDVPLPVHADADEYVREVVARRTRTGAVVQQQYVYRFVGVPKWSLAAFESALHVGFCTDPGCVDEWHNWPVRRVDPHRSDDGVMIRSETKTQ